MSKMTDKDIKKALECCGKNVLYENCGDCPYEKDFGKDHICTIKVAKDALDLINRLETENAELKSDLILKTNDFENVKGLYESEKAKVKKVYQKCVGFAKELQKARAKIKGKDITIDRLKECVQEAYKDGINEFVEQLEENKQNVFGCYYVSIEDIYNTVKGMEVAANGNS